jgi:hypothetical protein
MFNVSGFPGNANLMVTVMERRRKQGIGNWKRNCSAITWIKNGLTVVMGRADVIFHHLPCPTPFLQGPVDGGSNPSRHRSVDGTRSYG